MNHKWKDQYWFNPAASKFHEKFRQFLITDTSFRNFKCYQEVNVKSLVPSYPYSNHHYDWYISELGWIVELHGKQHYEPTAFGKIGFDQKISNFRNQAFRDSEKLIAALKEGFEYLIVPYIYQDNITQRTLQECIYETEN